MTEDLHIAIIMPTYNNGRTIVSVLEKLLTLDYPVIVVNDGSTDDTPLILQKYRDQILLIDYTHNKGKGYALDQGFKMAKTKGFDVLISIDSDGQHKVSDIPTMIEAIQTHPRSLIIGSRSFGQTDIPEKNLLANRISNFWFQVQTWIDLPDTQSGFRAYPIKEISKIHLFTHRYETELEILVRATWRGIDLKTIPIDVYYPPQEERITHFRPTLDFIRITLLNTVLCFLSLIWGYPSMIYHRFIRPFVIACAELFKN